jgi:hypothetical protein
MAWGDVLEPWGKLAPKVAYRAAESYPGIAGGIAGGLAGAATPIPGGALIGGAGGAAVGAAFQTLGPEFSKELQKNPSDPEGAWTRAKESAAISGAFSGAGWAAYPVKFFPKLLDGPVKQLAFQIAGVQPAVSVGQQAVQNLRQGQPITEGLGQAYGEGAAMTAVPALGHAIVTGRIGEAPKAPTVEDIKAKVAERNAQADNLERQMNDPRTSPDDAADLGSRARGFRRQAEQDQMRLDAPAKMKALNDQADAVEKEANEHWIHKSDPEAGAAVVADAQQKASGLRNQAKMELFLSQMPFESPDHGHFALSFIKNVAPELYSDLARRVDPYFARFRSASQRQKDIQINQAEQMRYDWNKVPDNDIYAFLRSFESPEKLPAELSQRYPWMERQAAMLRDWLDAAHNIESEHGSSAVFREDYFPHLYENPVAARNFLQNPERLQHLGPRPDFQKGRFHETIDDAVQAGLKLKTMNPVDMVTQRLMAGIDMVERAKLLNDLYEKGAAVPQSTAPYHIAYPNRGEPNPWRLINGPTGGTRMPDGTYAEGKQWFLSPDAQSLWDNAVSPKGLYHDEGLTGSLFRKWMDVKNLWVPIKLGMSLFHPVHVLHISLSNNVSRALNETFGKGQQGLYRRLISTPEAVAQSVTDAVLAMPLFGRKYTGIDLPMRGKSGREAWNKPTSEQNPFEQYQSKLIEESGIVPQRSRQMAVDAKRGFWDAWQKSDYLKSLWPGVREAFSKPTSFLFDEWIPNLKTAAVMREAESLFRRRPDLVNDEQNRLVAMRAIGKQVDNRFGEMFYGSLFWNRTLKDASIGSFLSLGWNLGFMREFVGGALEPTVGRLMGAKTPTRALIHDVTSKTTNLFVYTMTAATINAMITKSMTGDDPTGMDYIFPRVGGLNPDGSPRRISNPFYTREVPMAAKNIEEQNSTIGGLAQMMYHKMMYAPFIEMIRNKDYFGYPLHDPNAPGWQQVQQFGTHLLNENINPMSISGAQRSLQLSGKPAGFKDVMTHMSDPDVWMPLLGFGPAPAYASRSPLENRIVSLFGQQVAPGEKPFSMAENAKERAAARTQYIAAQQKGDSQLALDAAKKMRDLGMKAGAIKRLQPGENIKIMFGHLPPATQTDLLKGMDKAEFREYFPKAAKDAKRNQDVLDLVKKYYEIP